MKLRNENSNFHERIDDFYRIGGGGGGGFNF